MTQRVEIDNDQLLTLVAGATFCVSARDGGIAPSTWEGLYHRDARVLSRLELLVDGGAPWLLASDRSGAAVGTQTYVLAADMHGSPQAILVRTRTVEPGVMMERLVVHAYGTRVEALLCLALEADFADLAALRAGTWRDQPVHLASDDGVLSAERLGIALTIAVDGKQPDLADGTLSWQVDTAPGHKWETCVVLRASSAADAPAEGWSAVPPLARPLLVETADTRWAAGVASAVADLDGLVIDVPALGLRYLGAGVPWFMALFGRDTLIAGWQSLITGSSAGLDVLEALARYQGRRADAGTLEQPGRILHELRTGRSNVFGVQSGTPYYGSADSSPLFVMLLAELHRWGADPVRIRKLLPAARAAIRWCVEHGDADGDGYVEYDADPHGLANQGWKDSGDAMVHVDGQRAPTPIALAEVQGYQWAALRGLARLEADLGDASTVDDLRARAAALRDAFHRDFWLADEGLLAMGLDASKRPLAVAASNAGHCLWSGILRGEIASATAARLGLSDLRCRWGLRTLGANERAYNPLGYHLGTVWPHDTAIGAAGLMRYGATEIALKLVDGLLDAAAAFDWRLPELLAGLDGSEVPHPVPYPVACSPQAWSAAVPLLLLRTVLRLDPDVPAGRVHVAPVLPSDIALTVRGIPLGRGHLDLRVREGTVEVLRAPPGVEVVLAPAAVPGATCAGQLARAVGAARLPNQAVGTRNRLAPPRLADVGGVPGEQLG